MRRFITLLAVAAGLAVGFGWNAPVAHAADCDDNAIIKCGFEESGGASRMNQHFINIVKSNDSNNGNHDLINIYNSYGLDSSKYNDFVAYARQGQTYKNGKIVVDGRTVATDSNSIGRLKSYQGSGPFSKTINGHTYWGNSNSQAFLTDPLPVTVLFNNKGVAIFAVINSCGNPMGFTPVSPDYTCTNLTSHEVSGQPGSFTFKTNAKVANGATIQKLVYDFGDGTTKVSYDVNEVVTHTYTRSGDFHASVNVSVSLPFGHSDTIVGANTGCATLVHVELPLYACVLIKTVPLPDKRFTYQFVVTSKTLNGASLKGANFSFGDGQKANGVGRANATTVSVTHAYSAGSYSVMATLIINLPDGKTTTVTSSGCATTIKAAEYGCVQLTGEQPDETNPLAYRFTVAANATPKLATFSAADFDFGDGTKAPGVKPQALLATADHTYATAGDYTITTTLHFNVNGVAKSDICTAHVSKTVTPECRPGVPADSVLCSPCQYNNQLPADSPQCVGVLPNTGAGDVIALAGVTALVGFFLYRQFVYRKHVFHSSNGAVNLLLGETTRQHHAVKHEMATHNSQHRNKQGLSHGNYHRPHRFRPRSHGDK